MSVLLQSLVATGSRTRRVLTGTTPMEDATNSIAGTSDASDSTLDQAEDSGDSVSLGPNLVYAVTYAFAAAAVLSSVTIDFLRVKARSKYSKTGTTPTTLTVQPYFNGSARGSTVALTTSYVNNQWDFTTDPTDSTAWTNARINSYTDYGFQIHLAVSNIATVLVGYDSEITLEIWGTPQAQSLTLGAGAITNSGQALATPGVAITLGAGSQTNAGLNLGGRNDFYNPGPFSGQDIATITNAIPTPVDNANSAATGLQSNGCPYFAAVELADTQAGPDYGGAAAYQMVEIQAQFQSLPQQLVSPDEPHPLFSLTDGLTDQLWIGATPSGRLCGGDANNTLFSAPATLAADGQAHTLTFKLMAATQNLLPAFTYTLAVDGGIVFSTTVQPTLASV